MKINSDKEVLHVDGYDLLLVKSDWGWLLLFSQALLNSSLNQIPQKDLSDCYSKIIFEIFFVKKKIFGQRTFMKLRKILKIFFVQFSLKEDLCSRKGGYRLHWRDIIWRVNKKSGLDILGKVC